MDKPERKRRGPLTWLADRTWRFWVVMALLPALYVASYGPACWAYHRRRIPQSMEPALIAAYRPLDWLSANGPEPIGNMLIRYAALWIQPPFRFPR